jgi:hypothetical protein
MYNILLCNTTEKITSVKKWRENGYTFSDTNWSKIFELPFKTTQESKFHWLQYQILHRICPTNQYLFKLKIKDSPMCSLELRY